MDKEQYQKLRAIGARKRKARRKRLKQGVHSALLIKGAFQRGRSYYVGGSIFDPGGMSERFLKLMCAGDVLNSIRPMSNPTRDISKAMIAIQHLKRILLRDEGEYTLVELNPGRGLAGVLAAHLFPQLEKVYCFSNNSKIPKPFSTLNDIKEMGTKPPGDAFHEVGNFEFIAGNFDFSGFTASSTIGDLAETWNLFSDSGIDTQNHQDCILLCTNAHPVIINFLVAVINSMHMFKHAILIPTAGRLPKPGNVPESINDIPEVKEAFWLDKVVKSVNGYFDNYLGYMLPMGGTILYPKKTKKNNKK